MSLNPIKPLTDAIMFPFTFIYVVGLCAFINYFTSPGHWWVQWVAFGRSATSSIAGGKTANRWVERPLQRPRSPKPNNCLRVISPRPARPEP